MVTITDEMVTRFQEEYTKHYSATRWGEAVRAALTAALQASHDTLETAQQDELAAAGGGLVAVNRDGTIYECTGCGHVTRSLAIDNETHKRAGYRACCPERKMAPLARIVDLQRQIGELKESRDDYKAAYEDSKRLAREIDVAMHGEGGAAKQASLCDLVHPASLLRSRAETAEAALKASQEEVARLKAALEPFAELTTPPFPIGNVGHYVLSFADIRAARAALAVSKSQLPTTGEEG